MGRGARLGPGGSSVKVSASHGGVPAQTLPVPRGPCHSPGSSDGMAPAGSRTPPFLQAASRSVLCTNVAAPELDKYL